jgi:hypothetical protein
VALSFDRQSGMPNQHLIRRSPQARLLRGRSGAIVSEDHYNVDLAAR